MRYSVAVGLVLIACAHNVRQDAATGADGKISGAKPVAIENGEGRTKGIVTYPGGDRVDWRQIVLPEGKHGKLDVTLTWRPPRPGLQVAFDVFDQWNTPIAMPAVHKKHGRTRSATIDNAHGTYFVRIYAPGRGDAGAYKLVASFAEDTAVVVPTIAIPDPPHLPAVPPPEPTCDTFDPKIDACKDKCPPGAPSSWPGCVDTCNYPPDVNKAACQRTMACPSPADRRVLSCMSESPSPFPPCADFKHPDPNNPHCDKQVFDPVTARIINVQVVADGVLLTVATGSDQNVARNWSAKIIHADSGTPLQGSNVEIVRVGKTQTLVKAHVQPDLLKDNAARVSLTPP